jgi:biopolymer transport protein ExbB
MNLPFVSTAIAQTLSTTTSTISAAATSAASSAAANPYGLGAIWSQGDWVAKGCLLLLATMSVASWYVLVSKFLELRRLKAHNAEAHNTFSQVHNFSANVAKLSTENPLRFVADAGQDAARQFAALKPRVDYDTWTIRAIEQALSKVQTRMQEGMAVLATIGSTAPFVGLFGTVWAIYTALVKIGASGQASIDRVAGPVGEALIMTAIGLAVAVPAVFGYNWLLRKNKLALESMRSFGAKLHILLLATTYTGDNARPAEPAPPETKASKPQFSETKPQAPEQS